jgi:uncharacterized protein YciI
MDPDAIETAHVPLTAELRADGLTTPTADPPAEFDVYELVLLRRGHPEPGLDEQAAELLQRQHLGHLQAMRTAGHLAVAGPFRDQPDDSWRGLCIYRVGSLDEARRLAEADPAVRAGQLTVDVMLWYTPKGALPLAQLPESSRDAVGTSTAVVRRSEIAGPGQVRQRVAPRRSGSQRDRLGQCSLAHRPCHHLDRRHVYRPAHQFLDRSGQL